MPGKNSIFSMILATLLLCAAGNSAKGKITLDFEGGIIRIGDKMLAYGILDQETNTLVVSGEDDYIRTYAVKADVVGVVVRAEKLDDLTVFELLRSDGTFVTVHYTTTGAASTSFYRPGIKTGDYLRAVGPYDKNTNIVLVSTADNMLKTYDHNPVITDSIFEQMLNYPI